MNAGPVNAPGPVGTGPVNAPDPVDGDPGRRGRTRRTGPASGQGGPSPGSSWYE